MALDKTFNHTEAEPAIYAAWEEAVRLSTTEGSANAYYTITLPPPNITGSLHIGHAFTSTIQDALLRVKRQHGFKTLGQPGVDHAGIATQIVVDRQLAQKGISRIDIGREAFIEKVWEWKAESGGQIIYQLQRLGMSVDWRRLRFTMDAGSSRAVLHAFVKLYNDGLIYRAKKLVNWDPELKTAVSDLEVANKEVASNLWYIRYRAADGNGEISVATTRPETLFGDVAVAVHPDDERYKHWIGRSVLVPFMRREIPVIADEYSDPSKGSGAVKITPAHDFNDFEVGLRHALPSISILDEGAHLAGDIPEEFRGLSCQDARKLTLERLAEQGLLERTEPIMHSVPYNERSGAVIEPRLTDQWFINTKPLAEPAIKAVETGAIQFLPEQWKATYFEWMRNIQPWCISRQIWWGHQIPVWYTPDGQAFCAETEAEARQLAATKLKVELTALPPLKQDPDVLDTWFSSALWPFSTQGWPDTSSPDLARYPTDVLVTAFDIIFFWVARMVMFGLYFMKDVPFRTVYIHPLVRDEKGQKMSKSKGNVIDPLLLMDRYGTDAVRFTLAALAIPGRDIRLSESLVENGRNFITKIWNAAKFLEINSCFYNGCPAQPRAQINVWLLQKLNAFKHNCQVAFATYRLDLVGQNLQKFLRNTFCDIYLECIKRTFLQGSPEEQAEARATASWGFTQFLHVAHPLMPFVTEHLWKAFAPTEPQLIVSPWKEPVSAPSDAVRKTDWCVDLLQEIRSLRGILGIAPSEKSTLHFQNSEAPLASHTEWLCALGRLDRIEKVQDLSDVAGLHFVFNGVEFCLGYPAGVTLAEIRALLLKKADSLETDIAKIQTKLHNVAYKAAKPDRWSADSALCESKTRDLNQLRAILSKLT